MSCVPLVLDGEEGPRLQGLAGGLPQGQCESKSKQRAVGRKGAARSCWPVGLGPPRDLPVVELAALSHPNPAPSASHPHRRSLPGSLPDGGSCRGPALGCAPGKRGVLTQITSTPAPGRGSRDSLRYTPRIRWGIRARCSPDQHCQQLVGAWQETDGASLGPQQVGQVGQVGQDLSRPPAVGTEPNHAGNTPTAVKALLVRVPLLRPEVTSTHAIPTPATWGGLSTEPLPQMWKMEITNAGRSSLVTAALGGPEEMSSDPHFIANSLVLRGSVSPPGKCGE